MLLLDKLKTYLNKTMKEINLVQMSYYDTTTNSEVRKGDLFLSPHVSIDIDDNLMCIRTDGYISIGNRIRFVYDENMAACLSKHKLRDKEHNIDFDLNNIKYITAVFNYFVILDKNYNLIFTEDIEIITI